MPRKIGLGNIMDSIFDDAFTTDSEDAAGSIQTLKITDIEPNREQPRRHFDNEKLASLADSIQLHGIIQPITVRPYRDNYQIVAGERRWRAARMAGLSDVPVLIVELDDAQTMQIALIENLQREDLNPLEEANGYNELIEKYNMRQEDVAKKVGKARSSVTNSLRLLALPAEIKVFVEKNELSKGHCKALLGLPDNQKMIQLAKKAIDNGLSVHALEKLVQAENSLKNSITQSGSTRKKPVYVEAEISLSNSIGKTVRINEGKNEKVTIEIDVFSEAEVMEIINRLGNK